MHRVVIINAESEIDESEVVTFTFTFTLEKHESILNFGLNSKPDWALSLWLATSLGEIQGYIQNLFSVGLANAHH